MSTIVAKMVFASSTRKLIETGWKGNLPSGPLDMCTSTGARPIRKQSPATSHTCMQGVSEPQVMAKHKLDAAVAHILGGHR